MQANYKYKSCLLNPGVKDGKRQGKRGKPEAEVINIDLHCLLSKFCRELQGSTSTTLPNLPVVCKPIWGQEKTLWLSALGLWAIGYHLNRMCTTEVALLLLLKAILPAKTSYEAFHLKWACWEPTGMQDLCRI